MPWMAPDDSDQGGLGGMSHGDGGGLPRRLELLESPGELAEEYSVADGELAWPRFAKDPSIPPVPKPDPKDPSMPPLPKPGGKLSSAGRSPEFSNALVGTCGGQTPGPAWLVASPGLKAFCAWTNGPRTASAAGIQSLGNVEPSALGSPKPCGPPIPTP